MATKKKKKSKRPSVPEAHMVPTLTAPSEAEAPKYDPMTLQDFENYTRKAYELQLGYAPQVTEAQRQAQDVLFRNMSGLQREQAWNHAQQANQLLYGYNPEFVHQYRAQQGDLNTLGANVRGELAAGYELGPGLGREVEQAIRGAQTARGNILGAAPTAQEAFGKGQAAQNLYQQRLGNYNQFLGQQQNFIQGRNLSDLIGQYSGTFQGQNYYPSQAYVDTGLGTQAMGQIGNQQSNYNQTVMSGYSSFQNALQNYNQNQIGATNANNEAMFNQYDRAAEYWQYDEAVRRGLYSTPSVGGGGGGMGGMGSMLGAAGTAVGTGMMGLAASGVIGAGATAAGVGAAGAIGAAVSAAGAAICWLARRCLPERWQDFQRWLFTQAPDKLRRLYIYKAQRLSREVSDAEAAEIGELMEAVLCPR